jgi:hypothetical protein
VSFSIIAARADAVFSIKEELPQRVDVGAVARLAQRRCKQLVAPARSQRHAFDPFFRITRDSSSSI